MTDRLIEEIKRNREAGTPGKWRVEYRHGNTRLIMEDHPDPCQMCDETYYPWVPENLDDWLRIAAVPDMESRILADAAVIKAAEELANLVHDALEDGCDLCSGDCSSANPPVTYCPQKIRAAALAAFRKAQEAAK